MKEKTHTFKNLTMVFKYDKESKYYLDGDNVIQLDWIFMQSQCYSHLEFVLKRSRKKVTVEYDNVLKSISEAQFKAFIDAQDRWVDRQCKNIEPTGRNILLRLAK